MNLVGITNGEKMVDVHPNMWLEVKTHTPDLCFSADYAGAQTNQVILTPTAGKRIRIVSVYASSNVDTVDVTLKFSTSGNIFFKLYTSKKATAAGNTICAAGAVDETIELTCGAGTFVSIGYDEFE